MLLSIIFASLLVSCVSFVGAVFLLSKKNWKSHHGTTLVSFAAGVMLAAAFFDLLPEAQEAAGESNIFTFVFLGILVFFFLERFVLWFHHHHEGHGTKPTAVLVLVGDAVHNALDGIAIAAAFLIDPGVGVVTTLAIAAHEIPQELADLSILISSGMSRTKALFYNFLSGLTALVGALLTYFFLGSVEQLEWVLLAFTSGMFLYIACSDLIPELHLEFSQKQKWVQTLPLLAGAAILWGMVRLLEGGH